MDFSFIKRFDLKPKDQSKITLFANTAEAIVFWLSLSGLIFLGLISLFRFLTSKQSEMDTSFRRELTSRIEAVEQQNSLIKSKNDSLRIQIEDIKARLNK